MAVVMIVMTFCDWALDFAKGLDSDSKVEEVQVSIDPVTHYSRVLCTVIVITILFMVHRARQFC